MSLVVDEHRLYLSDPHRLDAFDRAIRSAVRAGDVVLDLASGTGILGLMACRAGAARVYSIDSGGIMAVAREAAKANGFGDRIHFIRDFSMHAALPERVDVVVADQVGNFGFNAGVVEYYADARARFLKPGGRMVPGRIELVVAPLEDAAHFAAIDFWSSRPAGFDFAAARELAANTGYQVDLDPATVLAQPASIAAFDLGDATLEPVRGARTFRASRVGTLHGLGGWFVAELAPGITMTNAPHDAHRIQRRQIFFPIDTPTRVKAGDEVAVELAIRPAESLVNWTVSVGGRRFAHSTWKGMLVDPIELARTRPDFMPRLNARGVARRTVVELCDGARTVAEIEREVRARHPDLFPTPAEAATFVAEVVTRYAD